MIKIITKLGAAMLLTASVYTAHAQMSFATKADYTTGTQPFNHAVGDLNNDGLADMVVVIPGNNTINVFLGTGAGAFGAKTDYSTGANSSPTHVAIGDLNNDGFRDLAVSNSLSNNISVFTNTGTGSFGTKRDYTTALEPFAIAIGDFNGDNIPDLATANFSANSISVLTNTGNSTFGIKRDYTTGLGSRPRSIAVGDLNNDGKIDIVVASQNLNAVSVFTNTGVGTFGTKIDYAVGSTPYGVAIGDLNNDGLLDIVSANLADDNISVLTNTGTGFGTKVDYGTGSISAPRNVAIGDFNGDGRPDLAVAIQNTDRIGVFTNTGTGFGAKIDIVTGTTPYSVVIGDFNNDGKPDLSSSNSGGNNASIILNTSVFPKPFVTEWNLLFPGVAGNNSLSFGTSTTGTVTYRWSTIPSGTSGSGSFSGTTCSITGLPANARISLSVDGTNFKSFRASSGLDSRRLTRVAQWGTVKWSTMLSAFKGCSNFNATATDVPDLSGVTSCKEMFSGCNALDGLANIGTWDVSTIQDMSSMFQDASIFNRAIGNWNVSSVTNMFAMFKGAISFNQTIGNWNVSSVTNMIGMFELSSSFNQPLNTWITSNLTDAGGMFFQATSFNQSLSNWNLANVTNTGIMFFGATSFNQSLGAWGTKLNNTIDMSNMLDNCGMSLANYEATLQGFAAGTVTGRTLGAVNRTYCNRTSRNILTGSSRNWIINGDLGQQITQIVTQPASVSTCAGVSATFEVSATGLNTLTYAWNNGGNIKSITTNVPGNYTVSVTGTCGVAVSTAVGLNALALTNIVEHPVSLSTCTGAFYNFTVSASGVGLTYAWSNGLSSTTSMMTSTAGTNYDLTVSGTCGVVVSNPFTLQLYELTKITTQPVSSASCNNTYIIVTAVGTNVNYAWNNGEVGTDRIFVTSTSSYMVTVTGLCGTEISNEVTFTKYEPFNIVTTPTYNPTILPGETTSLSVSATGSNITYLWSTGATTSGVNNLAAGNYAISITGSCGFNSYRVEIKEVPIPTITGIFTEGNPALATVATVTGLGFVGGSEEFMLFINNLYAPGVLNFSSTHVVITLLGIEDPKSNNPTIETIVLSSTMGAVMYAINQYQEIPSATVTITAINVLQPIPTTTGVMLSGIPANSITISGTGFVSGATVTVNGIVLSNITVIDGNTIVATLPSGFNASAVSLTVQNANQVAGTAAVVVNPINSSVAIASITGISANGALTSATSITISGTGFGNASTITVNGIALSNFTVVSGTSIIATIPTGTLLASNNVVLVQNPNQVASSNTAVVITDVTLPTNLPTYQATSFSVYPNPVTNGEEWRIENGEVGATMYVFNSQGAIVYTQSMASASTEVSAKLSSGIYLVKVGKQSVKLVVE